MKDYLSLNLKSILALTFLLQFYQSISFASTTMPLLEGITPEMVLQVVKFSGVPGVQTYAAIIERTKIDEENQESKFPSLFIFTYDPKTNTRTKILENEYLGLIGSGAAYGMYSELSTTPSGSLKIFTTNESIGRYRWAQTLTVAHRFGEFLLVGFNYQGRDTIDIEDYQSCEYNLLTGKGVRMDKRVKITRKPLPLSDLNDEEDEFLNSCTKW